MRSAMRTSRSSLRAPAGIVLDQEIELRAVAQHAEDDLRGQPGVARIESGGVGEQEVGRIAAALHLAEDVEGDGAGWGDGHSLQSKRWSSSHDSITPAGSSWPTWRETNS